MKARFHLGWLHEAERNGSQYVHHSRERFRRPAGVVGRRQRPLRDDLRDAARLSVGARTRFRYIKATIVERKPIAWAMIDDDFSFKTIFCVLRAGVKKDYGSMNPALCEMGGHLLTTGWKQIIHFTFFFSITWGSMAFIIDKSEYEAMTEEAVSNILQDMTSSWFQRLLPKIPLLFHDTFQDSSW